MSDVKPRRSARNTGKNVDLPSKKPERPNKSKTSNKRKTKQCTSPVEGAPDDIDTRVYLRVNQKFLLIHRPPTAAHPDSPGIPPPADTTGNLTIIVARLEELQPFSGNTVDWLHRVARLVLEPFGDRQLFTFCTNDVEYWMDRDRDDSWKQVKPGEMLRATIYEYCQDGSATLPTRICDRPDSSVTTKTTRDLATQFRTDLLARHSRCVISGEGQDITLVASHLIPRRLGDSGVQSVYGRFTNLPTANMTAYDKAVGLTLFTPLDAYVDAFEVGFWDIGNGRYEVHNFHDVALNVYGGSRFLGNVLNFKLHCTQINVGNDPPSGVFDWHYVQCVLLKFATDAFKGIPNIKYYVQPFRTWEDASDLCEFDEPENPPYPLYFFDLALSRAHQQVEDAEHRQDIEK